MGRCRQRLVGFAGEKESTYWFINILLSSLFFIFFLFFLWGEEGRRCPERHVMVGIWCLVMLSPIDLAPLPRWSGAGGDTALERGRERERTHGFITYSGM